MRRSIPFACLLILASIACSILAPVPPPPGDSVEALVRTMAADATSFSPPLVILFPTRTQAPTDTPTPTLPQKPGGAAACVPVAEEAERGLVTKVIDGGVIEVAIHDVSHRVCYIGVSAPGRDTLPGMVARSQNERMVGGQAVKLVKDAIGSDEKDCLLRYVFVGDVFVNYELVRQGFVTALAFPPAMACEAVIQQAGQDARSEQIGLWAYGPAGTAVQPAPISTDSASDTCDCYGPDLDCSNFVTRAAAQTCYDYCESFGLGDVFELDGDDSDGVACDGLP